MPSDPLPETAFEYDYLVVGGGTAGAIVAARLSQDPSVQVGLLEWGPSDQHEPRALQLRRWAEMLEGEYDLDYRCVPQDRGNSAIRQARATILGGCSSVNTMISWKPQPGDLREWVARGAAGWDPAAVLPYYDRLAARIEPVAPEQRNPVVALAVQAAVTALGVPLRETWNDLPDEDRVEGAGFFELGHDPATGVRSSSSVAYLHPVLDRPNLHVQLRRRALRLLLDGGRATGVAVRTPDGATEVHRARREVVVCCGAIDTPRLLQLSGIGPAAVLAAAGVDVLVDSPGVGENLQDHAEGLTVVELDRDVPVEVAASGWDAGVLARADPGGDRPDVLIHLPVETWGVHVENAGVEIPARNLSFASNVARPASRGRVWITSADPDQAPSVDYRYFTDPDGHDERMLVAGIRMARRIAATEPLASMVVREVFPGPDAVTDEEISARARATHQTVYHVSGTCRMGADGDPLAVLDPRLRVRGVTGLRVVDASAFPTVPSVNPVITVMVLAERAVDLIRADHQPH